MTIDDMNLSVSDNRTNFIFFGGKGGVGKSTIAAATAVWFAKQNYKTLIVSVDLQKSLNDIFEQKIDTKETKVRNIQNLWAVNTNVKENIRKHQLKQIKIVIFDTAPGGHSLELLQEPVKRINTIYTTIKARRYGSKFLKNILKENINTIKNLRSNRTMYILISIAEKLPVFETKRIAKDLKDFGIKVKHIVINNILPEEVKKLEFFRERIKMQNKYIKKLKRSFLDIRNVFMLPKEAIGIDALEEIGNNLYGYTVNKLDNYVKK